MSIRCGRKTKITRRNSMLADLSQGDIVYTLIEGEDENSASASRELIVHQAIYLGTAHDAVVHAHPAHATALSLTMNKIVPIDSEGHYSLGTVPVLSVDDSIGSREVADRIPEILAENPMVMVAGHGSFAAGKDLEEAFRYTSCLEMSSKIIWLNSVLNSCGGVGCDTV